MHFLFLAFILPCAPKREVAALFDLRRLQYTDDEWNKTVSLPVMRQNISFFPIIFSVRVLWKLHNKAAAIKKKDFYLSFLQDSKRTGETHCIKNPFWPINAASEKFQTCNTLQSGEISLCTSPVQSFLSVLSALGTVELKVLGRTEPAVRCRSGTQGGTAAEWWCLWGWVWKSRFLLSKSKSFQKKAGTSIQRILLLVKFFNEERNTVLSIFEIWRFWSAVLQRWAEVKGENAWFLLIKMIITAWDSPKLINVVN